MHLLAPAIETVSDTVAVDLGQTPGDIVLLSAADSDLALWAAARRRLGADFPRVRLANLLQLGHPFSVDLYTDQVLAQAKLIIVRLLGGVGYWRYGVERLERLGVPFALLPGDVNPDPDLAGRSTLAPAVQAFWHRCFVEGGVDNAEQALRRAADLIGVPTPWQAPAPLPNAWMLPVVGSGPRVLVIVYRALLQAGDTGGLDALVAALAARGLSVQAMAVASLKDADAIGLLGASRPDLIITATGFAIGEGDHPLRAPGCPVLQVAFAQSSTAAWREGARGLGPRDIAMHVALPEVDGRIFAGAIAFKERAERCTLTEGSLRRLAPVAECVDHAAALAAAWVRLRSPSPSPANHRIGIVFGNYPTRDGRIGNGVGLDVPASAVVILRALADAGYAVADLPADGAAVMAALTAGPTNEDPERAGGGLLSGDRYRAHFATLPEALQAAVMSQWGAPETDPSWVGDGFRIPALTYGAATILIQPSRGYGVDALATAHSPDLVPPHGYLARYLWLRERVDAVIQLGKHGTLEWLPGKSVALSAACWPQAVLGPMPVVYPFIVNDPGEGAQAKRRTAAAIIDHLTPPLTRAESYGPLKDLEQLVDEYHTAASLDPKRRAWLGDEILTRIDAAGLAAECGIAADDDLPARLTKLDQFLCELKELQIRDGLHVFGTAPDAAQTVDLLVALTRIPRGERASLIRALADDLCLGFDPLHCRFADVWDGPRPARLVHLTPDPWRSTGDTVERLEHFARALVAGTTTPDGLPRAATVLQEIATELRPKLAASARAEVAALTTALAGGFVPPGPSGAPTRGRPDVLPTGRNFHSVDPRALPTPAAWALAQRSAAGLLERHAQETGSELTSAILTVWGTATMRTGGDDIAQALALMGVRPVWDAAAARVTGLEVLTLDRPRVDVSLRISGFFRDAFPALIDLFDRAVQLVADRDEPLGLNPLAAAIRRDVADGVPLAHARRRIYGAKPGSYGAGLQALIDERAWRETKDLAHAVIAWGGYAYGSDGDGGAADALGDPAGFARRLGTVQAVLHNQDNREHDLLDSDDYYQFEGGLTVAATVLQGARPQVWHQDHSRPERPVTRSLAEELALIIRGRAVNPKWIAGALRHGYKGAAEIAATVDYAFAFAATTGAVSSAQFDALYHAYIGDPAVRAMIAAANPAALREIGERFAEAIERGLWQPRANTVIHTLDRVRTP